LDGLQILWLLANPLWTHGIGESGSKTITGWLLMGAADANHIWWLSTNPSAGLLLHLNSYRIRHLPFGYWNMFFFNCFVTGNEMTIIDELTAADANQVWWFKTNPSSGSLPQPN